MRYAHMAAQRASVKLPEPAENEEGDLGGTPAAGPLSNSASTDPRLERIEELLPDEKRGELLQVITSHHGWLPPPQQLADYENILPGLAERIVRMPEREQEHRHRFLDEEGQRQFVLKRWGQHYALLGMLLLLAFSVFLALIGEPGLAGTVAVSTIAAVVGIFVTGKVADVKAAKAEEE